MFKIGDAVMYNNQKCTIIDKRTTSGPYVMYMIQGADGEKKVVREICLRAVSVDDDKVGKIGSSNNMSSSNILKIDLKIGALFQGIMAYWDKVEDAMQYNVKLYIKSCEISTVVVDRNTRYHTFQGLAPRFGYFVIVEAEDRNGKIIAISDKQQAEPDMRIAVFAPDGIRVYH